MEKKRISRQIYVSETADNFLKQIKAEGGDDMAFAGILFEMAIQMVRSGHITWSEKGFECKTEKGIVTVNVKKPSAPAKPEESLADIAKSMKGGASNPSTPPPKPKLNS